MAQQARSFDTTNDDRIQIIARGLEATNAIRDYIHKKIQKIEENTPQVIDVVVIIELQKGVYKVEILYKFSHFKVMSHATMHNLYEAIDQALLRLKGKIRKWKTKIQSTHAKQLSAIDQMNIQVLNTQVSDLDVINDQIEETNLNEIEKELAPPQVVKRSKRALHMLTIEEAAMQIDLSGDNFLVYKSEEDQKLKVMYVRSDKSLGILEIE